MPNIRWLKLLKRLFVFNLFKLWIIIIGNCYVNKKVPTIAKKWMSSWLFVEQNRTLECVTVGSGNIRADYQLNSQ